MTCSQSCRYLLRAPGVYLPEWACAVLDRMVLDALRREVRGQYSDLDYVLGAVHEAGLRFRVAAATGPEAGWTPPTAGLHCRRLWTRRQPLPGSASARVGCGSSSPPGSSPPPGSAARGRSTWTRSPSTPHCTGRTPSHDRCPAAPAHQGDADRRRRQGEHRPHPRSHRPGARGQAQRIARVYLDATGKLDPLRAEYETGENAEEQALVIIERAPPAGDERAIRAAANVGFDRHWTKATARACELGPAIAEHVQALSDDRRSRVQRRFRDDAVFGLAQPDELRYLNLNGIAAKS